ncbi:tRNA(Ile)(2)-agmatinylcytidine synthase [Halomarina ordinaria]|uniref:tRNA(Ile2) 2-agmatinylcytidine synthetase TiaS n=1 Tax=Halomarina ordinaria TaxID=3033939 RepID=A0ABD5UE30_9EURY|nr:tRNA(Ile)(2)-agmatinylcytidine synthase [Halomarina sp. PSRA2]
MTIVGLDDTDSREQGMCTTFVAARLAERLRERGRVERLLLVRLNPAVKHKTRGNAALAVHTDVDPATAFDVAYETVDEAAVVDDDRTNPGLVVLPDDPDDDTPVDGRDALAAFARAAVRDHLTIADAEALVDHAGYRSASWGDGRGRIGALAAAGAWAAWRQSGADEGTGVDTDGTVAATDPFAEWTYERISYRERERWGTDRQVDADSAFAAADREYPLVWDTVDRETGAVVCVPHTPCPILHGVRGDDPEAVARTAAAIEGESVLHRETFLTNQGTDAHLREGTAGEALDGRAYRLDGTVTGAPETRRGGHVFLELTGEGGTIQCAAFEPTKHFRDRVRALRTGDELTVCGEFTDRAPDADTADGSTTGGTLKLEKFAVRDLVRTERVTPTCPDCDRRMESAGRDQGYRCRDCGTTAEGKAERPVDRDLDLGWYEVPPCARRHIAKPLVRGGFDAPTYPER